MKRFLLHYAAYADISIKGDAPLKPGDTVLLIPSGTSAPTSAQPASSGEDLEDGAEGLLVSVDRVKGNAARGMVIQGDTDRFLESELLVFSTDDNDEAKDLIGTAGVTSESKKISTQ